MIEIVFLEILNEIENSKIQADGHPKSCFV